MHRPDADRSSIRPTKIRLPLPPWECSAACPYCFLARHHLIDDSCPDKKSALSFPPAAIHFHCATHREFHSAPCRADTNAAGKPPASAHSQFHSECPSANDPTSAQPSRATRIPARGRRHSDTCDSTAPAAPSPAFSFFPACAEPCRDSHRNNRQSKTPESEWIHTPAAPTAAAKNPHRADASGT